MSNLEKFNSSDEILRAMEERLAQLQAENPPLSVDQTWRAVRVSTDLLFHVMANGPIGGTSPPPGAGSPLAGGGSATGGVSRTVQVSCPGCSRSLKITVS